MYTVLEKEFYESVPHSLFQISETLKKIEKNTSSALTEEEIKKKIESLLELFFQKHQVSIPGVYEKVSVINEANQEEKCWNISCEFYSELVNPILNLLSN